MIYSSLGGGLGNLLFEVAAGASHARRKNVSYQAHYGLDDISKPRVKGYLKTILRKIAFSENKPEGYEEWCQDSCKPYIPVPDTDDILLGGLFQSYKYIDEPYVRNLFEIDPVTEAYIEKKYASLLAMHPVSVHVRRGDYLLFENRDVYAQCSLHYYMKAMELIGKDHYFLVISNDRDWCKKHFKGKQFLFPDRESELVDLYLQSKCRHHIIANSTFSWWGAWLNPNPDKKVIYPTPWYGFKYHKVLDVSTLCPPEWTPLEIYPNRISALYHLTGQMQVYYTKRIVRRINAKFQLNQ